MLQKIKKIGAVVTIIVLLPYVVTIFINGRNINISESTLLDEYCIGVLAQEVSSDYEDEMLKAQAVLVRTTVYGKLKEMDKGVMKKPDLDSNWYERLKSIWKETEGQVLMYNEEPALAAFHQLSNGKTRSGTEVFGGEEYPYLQVKECPKDVGSDFHMQTKVLDLSEVKILSRDSAGYVTEVQIGEKKCSGDSFRDTYGLASGCFELQEFDGKTRAITKGVGHGLGLSQYTANEMAKEGKSYKEILQFFFEGTELKEVAEILWDTE